MPDPNPTPRLDALPEEEKAHVEIALSALTPALMEQIAKHVTEVCKGIGIGRVYITIEKGHLHLVGREVAEKVAVPFE